VTPTLSVIVASSGRATLERTLQSISPQLHPGDELLVDVNDNAPWGHEARNRLMGRAEGDAMLFIDDDDVYTPFALAIVRAAFGSAPEAVHLFRMRYASGVELWAEQQVVCGNVSTQMVCVPGHVAVRHRWGARYEGDFDFICSVCGDEWCGAPCWHEDVTVLVDPA
jgi:glycosyltransferase involved in cell wall biosynthesis